MHTEAPIVSLEIPYVIEEEKEKIDKVDGSQKDKKHLPFSPPRLFRRSLIFKTRKLFKEDDEELIPKLNRPLKENLWWFVIMMIGFLLAFSITDKAWQKFQKNPTFTSLMLNKEEMKIVYPTISVCADPVYDYNKLENLVKASNFPSNISLEIIEFLKEIPNFSFGKHGLKSLVLSDKANDHIDHLNHNDVRTLAFQLALSCNDIFSSCHFKNESIDCCKVFKPIYSEHGICYSFNSKLHGTPINDVLNTNLLTVDEFNDLKFLFDLKVQSKIFLNSAEETLHFDQRPIVHTELQMKFLILISMEQTESDETIESLSIHQRECVYKDEKKLKYFNDQPYSYSGCMMDCRIDQSLEICGCLPPFHRSSRFNNLTYCDLKGLKCLKDEKILNIQRCSNCELSCNFTTFTLENVHQDFSHEDNVNITNVTIDFNHWPILKFHREVRFGFIDFLVAFGSILALFLSFSLLSAIEVLLYVLRFTASRFCPKKS